jgi:hypothetical protein
MPPWIQCNKNAQAVSLQHSMTFNASPARLVSL